MEFMGTVLQAYYGCFSMRMNMGWPEQPEQQQTCDRPLVRVCCARVFVNAWKVLFRTRSMRARARNEMRPRGIRNYDACCTSNVLRCA